jgi:membrane protease YdiL (CAAX protease family)
MFYTALVVGLGAGFCEEIMFRGFMMTELAEAGYGRLLQVLVSGVLFGCLHVGMLRVGVAGGLAVIIPTAVLGIIYSLVYLTARRSLMPSIVSHFINDAVVIPLIFMAQALGAVH